MCLDKLFWVILGGALGSALRYAISFIIEKYFPINGLSLAILSVNLLGSFAVGIWLGVSMKGELWGETGKAFFVVGFCGGFTTFSAFMREGLYLLQSRGVFLFFAYTTVSIVFGLLFVWLGFRVSGS